MEPPELHSHLLQYSKVLAEQYRSATVYEYLRILHSFNRFQAVWPAREAGWAGLESEVLTAAWVREQSQRVGPRNAGGRLGALRHFLQFLCGTDKLGTNPVDVLRERYPRRGLRGLAEALGSEDPEPALEVLRPAARFSSVWGPPVMVAAGVELPPKRSPIR